MQPDERVSLFDQQAAGTDRQWTKTSPIRDCLYFLLEPLFAELRADARELCVVRLTTKNQAGPDVWSLLTGA